LCKNRVPLSSLISSDRHEHKRLSASFRLLAVDLDIRRSYLGPDAGSRISQSDSLPAAGPRICYEGVGAPHHLLSPAKIRGHRRYCELPAALRCHCRKHLCAAKQGHRLM
jgi:hypothetical protein